MNVNASAGVLFVAAGILLFFVTSQVAGGLMVLAGGLMLLSAQRGR